MVGIFEVALPIALGLRPCLFDHQIPMIVFLQQMRQKRVEVGDAFAEGNGAMPLPACLAILEIHVQDPSMKLIDDVGFNSCSPQRCLMLRM